MTKPQARLQQAFADRSAGVHWEQQGQYHYQCNGKPTDIEEPWRIGMDAKGHRIIQSLRFSKQHQMLLTVHWQQQGETAEQGQLAELSWQQGSAKPSSACYQLAKNHWQCQSGSTLLSGEQDGPWHFFPLLRVFSGAMVLALQQEQPLLLPNLELGADAQRLLPLWDRRQSFLLEKNSTHSTYAMQGGHYRPDNARFVLAQDGLLQRYHWQQTDALRWDIALERLK
ncbi:hypothetical protein QWY20_16630 [Alkalimonas sp. MEB108]|uniref:Uncharacterized protein n=1 Tax=Alkalimonas cellulosilytica TaxID=3058395 RepID=A0ABU7J9C7_9GAMM|nr:hypothetical protein [Alkalimonas sp. MEB108]MEE2003087.1 hypothetical protein [Alkalimonas sp. MEB108]